MSMSRHQKDPEPGDKQRGFIKGLSHSVGVFIEAVIGGLINAIVR